MYVSNDQGRCNKQRAVILHWQQSKFKNYRSLEDFESLNSDGQQFHQYQQIEQSLFTSNYLTQKDHKHVA
jgi:hypothetical protein